MIIGNCRFADDVLYDTASNTWVRFEEDGTATVGINTLQTVDQQNGCRNWSGQYQLTYTSGTWLITSANLTPTAC